MNTSRFAVLSLFSAALLPILADVIPVSPAPGSTIPLLPAEQKKVLSLDSQQARGEYLQNGNFAKHGPHPWHKPLPFTLKWRTTEGEKGPWRIVLATTADLSGGREILVGRDDARPEGKDGSVVWRYTVPLANLEAGRTYHWKVWSQVTCPHWSCIGLIPENGVCACGRTKGGKSSQIASFSTEDAVPRWLLVEGRVKNIRDFGGWRTTDGRRVRQGMAYRGQGLNDNSFDGRRAGRMRLTLEDVRYLTETLGIKTDLDLRSPKETAGISASPLGNGVAFVMNSSQAYDHIFRPEGKKSMAENFRLFCDKSRYPIYFHCIGGADRTGSLAYVLNGVLGVGKEDLERDWESTFYPNIPGLGDPAHWQGTHYFDEGFAKYGGEGATLRERIELYLLDCGITRDEIAAFRALMLED